MMWKTYIYMLGPECDVGGLKSNNDGAQGNTFCTMSPSV